MYDLDSRDKVPCERREMSLFNLSLVAKPFIVPRSWKPEEELATTLTAHSLQHGTSQPAMKTASPLSKLTRQTSTNQ